MADINSHKSVERGRLRENIKVKSNGGTNQRETSQNKNDESETVMNLARQKVDTAIGLIKREVEIQREKSNSMCRLRTAHNWTEDKEKFKDSNNPNELSFFMKAHTVTVLIFLICCLVYVGLIEEPIEDNTSYNSRRGLTAALFFWVAAGMTIMPDGPFMRPHPAFWRFCFAVSIAYELLLIFVLFQSANDARKLLKFLDQNLGEPIPEKDYGGNCRIYDFDNPKNPYHNIYDKVDIFIAAHAIGYWCKTLIFRDWWFATVISVMFEFLEYSLEHQLPNFSECWWDHWILDVLLCNGLGTVAGIMTLRHLRLKTYDWRGLWNIPTYRGKIKRIIAQFSPHAWIEYTWNPLTSLERWLSVVGIIFFFLVAELNTFYLKFVLWFPPEHWLNFVRLGFVLCWGAVGLRETFQFLDDPDCDKLGRQTWVVIAIVCTEFLICVKFGWHTITKPLPRYIGMWWLAGLVGVIVYTLVKFVLFKPTKLPKPEKEQVRLSPIHSNFCTDEINPIEEDCEMTMENKKLASDDKNDLLNSNTILETELIVDLSRSNDKIRMMDANDRLKDKHV